MSKSKDLRSRKFHCEKEDMINDQKNAMKLKPIGSKANASDVGSESDSGSDKDEWICYDYSDIEDEFKPKPTNEINTEEISSDEEEILTKPDSSEKVKGNTKNSTIPLENLEEISSDDNDDNVSKPTVKPIIAEEHMESISSDEEVTNTPIKKVEEKKSASDEENLQNYKVTDEALSDIENVSSIDEKEAKHEKKGMEAISSDEQEEFNDTKANLTPMLEKNSSEKLEVVTSCENDLLNTVKIEMDNNDIAEQFRNTESPIIFDTDNIKEESNHSFEESNGKPNKELDAISSDEENWNDATNKKSKVEKLIPELNQECDSKLDDAVSISSEEEVAVNTESKHLNTKKKTEAISSDDNFSLSEEECLDVPLRDDNLKDENSLENYDSRFELDYHFFSNGPEYDNDSTSDDKICDAKTLLQNILDNIVKCFNGSIQNVSGVPKNNGRYSEVILLGDFRIKNLMPPLSGDDQPSPRMWCKEDLAFDDLISLTKTRVLPLLSNANDNVLLVCSLGIIDALKAMQRNDTCMISIVEDIIRQMKAFKMYFKKNFKLNSDVVFTNLLPLDVKMFLKFNKLDSEIYSSSLLNTMTAKFYIISYLLEKNMMAESLSKLDELLPWNIYFSQECMDKFLNNLRQGNSLFLGLPDGINPNDKMLEKMAVKVSKLFVDYNKRKEIKVEERSSFKNVIIYSCYDIKVVLEELLEKLPYKIYIHHIPEMTIDNVTKHVPGPNLKEPNSLLIIQLGTKDLVSITPEASCEGHDPLRKVTSHEQFSKEKGVEVFLEKIKSARITIKDMENVKDVIFTTLFQLDIESYQKHLVENHENLYGHRIMLANEQVDDSYRLTVCRINEGIVQILRSEGLPSWDFLFHMSKRIDDSYIATIPLSLLFDEKANVDVAKKLSKIIMEFANQTDVSINYVNERNKRETSLKTQRTHPKPKSDKSRTPSLSPPPAQRYSGDYENYGSWKHGASQHPYQDRYNHGEPRKARKFKRNFDFMGASKDPNFWKRKKADGESSDWRNKREVCYPRDNTFPRSRSPSYGDTIERERVSSYPSDFSKNLERKRKAISPSREVYNKGRKYSPLRERGSSSRERDYNVRKDIFNRRDKEYVIKREEYHGRNYSDKKPQHLVSREEEEWDDKEKRKRRVVNYGRLSDEEDGFVDTKNRFGSDEENRKKHSKNRKGSLKDDFYTCKNKLHQSSSRSRSKDRYDDWNYDKRPHSEMSRDRKCSRYPEPYNYKGDETFPKEDSDEVVEAFYFMKKAITCLGSSTNWIRLMYDNAVQLKSKKEDTFSIMDNEAINVLTKYQNTLKKEIKNENLSKSEVTLFGNTITKIYDLVQTVAHKRDPYLGLNVEVLARGFLTVDTDETLKGIRSLLRMTGYPNVKEDIVMQIYVAIKVEQEKITKNSNILQDPAQLNQSLVYSNTNPSKSMHSSGFSGVPSMQPVLQAPPPPMISSYQIPPPTAMPGIPPSMSTSFMQISSQTLQGGYGMTDTYSQPPPLPPPTIPQQPPPLPPGPHPSSYTQPPPQSLYNSYATTSTNYSMPSTSVSNPNHSYYSQVYSTSKASQPIEKPKTHSGDTYSQNQYYATNYHDPSYMSNQQYQMYPISNNSNGGSVPPINYEHHQPQPPKVNETPAAMMKDINNMKPEELIDMFARFNKLPLYQQSFLLQVLEEFKRKDPTLAETVKKMMNQSES